MSGSGGGGYVSPQRAEFDCETGVIDTSVASVDLRVLLKHMVGTILDVELSKTQTVTIVDGDGEILGSVVHINTTELINCINRGNVYQATITRINNPTCIVRIKRE